MANLVVRLVKADTTKSAQPAQPAQLTESQLEQVIRRTVIRLKAERTRRLEQEIRKFRRL